MPLAYRMRTSYGLGLLPTYRFRRFYRNWLKIVYALLFLLTIVTLLSPTPLRPVSANRRRRNDARISQLNSSASRAVGTGERGGPSTVDFLMTSFTRSRKFARCGPSVQLQRPSLPSAEPQRWQPVRNRNVRVFSAYVDRRLDVGGPLVRIIAIGLQNTFNPVGQLYCRMWFVDGETETSVLASPATYELIHPNTLHPTMWVAHFVLCPLGGRTPQYVSVVDQRCRPARASNILLVLDSDRASESTNRSSHNKRRSVSFALCLPSLSERKTSGLALIEWIELHRLLGVSEVILYNATASPEVCKVLESYMKDAGLDGFLLTVIQWQLTHDYTVDHFNELNDCIYRAALRHRYVVISDFDEVLVPRQPGGWPRFVAEVATNSSVGAFLFQPVYFLRISTSSDLITLQSLWRTNVLVLAAGDLRCKALYDTQKVIKVGINHPHALLPNSQTMIVDSQVGLLHHYSAESKEAFAKYRYVQDSIMLQYNDALETAVQQRVAGTNFTE